MLFPKIADYHLCFRLLEERQHFPFTGDLVERSLKRAETPPDQLAQRSLEELGQLVDKLFAQINLER